MKEFKHMTLNPSLVCNRKCLFCANLRGKEEKIKNVYKILKTKREENYDAVTFSGGEPTIQRELPDWISYARKLGYTQIIIVTNGSKLGDSVLVNRLIDSGLTHVNISFHSSHEETFDTLFGVPGAYKETVAGIKNLLKINKNRNFPLKIHANIVLTSLNTIHLKDTVNFLGELGIPIITVEICRFKGEAKKNRQKLEIGIKEVKEAINKAIKAAKNAGVKLNHTDIPACFLDSADAIDFEEYNVKKHRIVHRVVSEKFEHDLNRDTHKKFEFCLKCPFTKWCSGIEKSLLSDTHSSPASMLRLWETAEIITEIHEKFKNFPKTSTKTTVLEVLKLFSPPDEKFFKEWAKLYVELFSYLRKNGNKPNEIIGVLNPNFEEKTEVPKKLLYIQKKRIFVLRKVIEEINNAIAEAILQQKHGMDDHYTKDSDSLWIFLKSVVYKEKNPLLNTVFFPSLLTFNEDEKTAGREKTLRYILKFLTEKLPQHLKKNFLKIVSSPVLVLSPYVKIVLSGVKISDNSVRYNDFTFIIRKGVLTKSVLTFIETMITPFLAEGDTIIDEPDAILIYKNDKRLAAFDKIVEGVNSLLIPDAKLMKEAF